MKPDWEKDSPVLLNLSRRELIALIGATGAASLVASTGEPSAFAEEKGPTPQNSKPRIVIEAKPEAIAIDIAKTAVIVVDMHNDFGSKGGMFHHAGIDISMIQQAVLPTARVLAAARRAGIKVVYLKMAFLPDLSDMGRPDSPNWRVHHEIGRAHV